MDQYSTEELIEIFRNLKVPQTFLTRRYFGAIRQSDKSKVHIDIEKGKRRLAPFVSPKSQGKIVETLRHQTDTITPAYIKDKRPFDPENAIDHRTLGEALLGDLSPEEREARWVAMTLVDQQEMIDRRLEWMAVQIMLTGQVTISGEGFDDIVVDFLRAAAQTIALAGAARWGEAGVDPYLNLQTWSLLAQKNSGAAITEWVMEPDAFDLFSQDARVQNLLDTRRGSSATLESAPPGRAEPQFQGSIGNFGFWTYQDWYEDPVTEVDTQLLPQYAVLGVSSGFEGRQHYGAIRDKKAGYRALPFFPKMWDEEDPAGTYLMAQSAPILAPGRPDASVGATVR